MRKVNSSTLLIFGMMLVIQSLCQPIQIVAKDSVSALPTAPSPKILISALHYFGYESNADEAVQLTNPTTQAVLLNSQWSLLDEGNRVLSFPSSGISLAPKSRLWVANDAAAFTRQFGFSPTLSYAEMSGKALTFANDGGSVRLQYAVSQTLDTANANGGAWDAGAASPGYRSMERIDSGALDIPSNWASANPITPIAFDADNNPITGTPRAPNSVAVVPSTNTSLSVVINEVAWAGTKANANHEWLELYNNTALTVSLSSWQIRSSNSDVIALTGNIGPLGYYLVQRNSSTPVFSSGAAADQSATFSLSNSGATLELVQEDSAVVDTLVYGNGTAQPGWLNAPLQPYTVTQIIPADGQVLMRKLGADGLPAADTNTAQDWLNDRTDPIDGRKSIYPGWRFEQFFAPVSASSPITLAVAPDASFDVVSQTLSTATTSIDLEAFTFDNAHLGELLANKVRAGVRVRVLLDGAPVGGLTDQMKYVCTRISEINIDSGCWYLRSDDAAKVHPRYAYLHAKFAVIDNARLLVSSENFGINGMPDDDKGDGTSGHRGTLAVVEAPELIARANAIFAADFNPAQRDITRWCITCTVYGPPSLGFTPIYTTGGISYTVRFAPLRINAPMSVTLATSPESHVRSGNSILALLNAAGAGDDVLVEELDEPHHWGATASDATADPNVRLSAMLGAASRGAKVRLVLDKFYDNPTQPRSNAATLQYVLSQAATHGWDVRAVRANITGHGIHNKMILVRLGNRAFAQIGSWNGSETSAKRNREMSLLIESQEAYTYLSRVFQADFALAQPIFLPVTMRGYAPKAITYPLISEVLFNAAGPSEVGREWIEIYNPGSLPISLNGYKIGDAAIKGGNFGDGMYAFPVTATLPPNGVMVIAENALLFKQDWGVMPSFEIGNYDPAVPDLVQYSAWSTGTMSLANMGDEVLLLGPDDSVMDAAVWGIGSIAGTLPFTRTFSVGGHTLQRWPPGQDSNDCNSDFREQVLPSVGVVP